MSYPWGSDTDCMTNGFERPDSGQRLTYWKSLISITQLFLIKIWLSRNRWGWVKIWKKFTTLKLKLQLNVCSVQKGLLLVLRLKHWNQTEKSLKQGSKDLGKTSIKKKNVFFRALPESPNPPPMTPIRATWSSFFGSQNSRFESQFRT